MLYNVCPHCKRAEHELHICRSMRTFRGYKDVWSNELNLVITSWLEWKRLLKITEPVVAVRDEYGVHFDPEKFIEQVEKMPKDIRRKQYDWVQVAKIRGEPVGSGGDWLDADGFSFYGGEFS